MPTSTTTFATGSPAAATSPSTRSTAWPRTRRAQDVADTVDWATRNIGGFGGSAARIFLIGHSAGGTHVATCLFDPEFPGRPAASVAGAVLLSARLRADVLAGNPNVHGVRAYFGSDESLYEPRSPVTHAHCSQVPLMIAIAQFENPYLDLYGADFFHRRAFQLG